MKVTTKSVILKKDASDVFNYVSQIENLPKWAFNFCKSVRKEGNDYKIETPMGELFFDISTDMGTGVLDMIAGPTKDQMTTCPARVIALPNGESLFSMTCMQAPGVSDEEYAQQSQSIDEELDALEKAVA